MNFNLSAPTAPPPITEQNSESLVFFFLLVAVVIGLWFYFNAQKSKEIEQITQTKPKPTKPENLPKEPTQKRTSLNDALDAIRKKKELKKDKPMYWEKEYWINLIKKESEKRPDHSNEFTKDNTNDIV